MAEEAIVEQDAESQPIDVRSLVIQADVDTQNAVLAEYVARRQNFRDWLMEQLTLGVHYGTPPGCEPKVDDNGNYGVWNGKRNCMMWYPPEQWTPTPSLYKAGADFICDLMQVVDVYEADMAAWEQLGKPKETFVFTCRLFPKGAEQRPETLVGEGRGVRRAGQKGGDANNAIKMAKKCAKVDAVLNGFGLADLFTQDLEDMPAANPPETPKQRPNTAAVPPREDTRGSRLKDICQRWNKLLGGRYQDDERREKLATWLGDIIKKDLPDNWTSGSTWDKRDLKSIEDELHTLERNQPKPDDEIPF